MDLFKMAGIDTSEFNSDNKTSQHKDANATSDVSSSSSSKDADADASDNKTSQHKDANVTSDVSSSSSSKDADTDVIKATNDANDASVDSVDSDYQTSKIQYEEATNHDLADVKRERDRIGTAMMIKESILHDLKVQLVLLKRGSDDSDDDIKRISDVKYRIAHVEEAIDAMNKQLEQLK